MDLSNCWQAYGNFFFKFLATQRNLMLTRLMGSQDATN